MPRLVSGLAVVLFGLDGSGKTTQADLLVDYAKKRGIPCRYLWLRVPWRASIPLMALNRMVGVSRKRVSDSGVEYTRTELWRRPFLSSIWKKWILFHFRRSSSSRVKKPVERGELVVIDRYVFDALVDYAIDNNDDLLVDRVWEEFIGIVPENCKAFYFDIPAETAKSRKHSEDLHILKKRRELYQKIAQKYGALQIDAARNKEEIHRQILRTCNFNV